MARLLELPLAGQGIIWTGDCLELLGEIPAGLVSLVLTSPPYPGLKNCVLEPADWLDWFISWADAVAAVMKPNGVFALSVWFGRAADGYASLEIYDIPRIARALGLRLMDTYIYGKLNPPPNGPLTYCDPPGWEPVFVFTNAVDVRDVTFNPVRRPYASKSLRASGDVYTSRKQTVGAHSQGARQSTLLLMSKSADQNRPHAAGISFPRDLPRRFIEQYTNPGDLVADPFAGVGTTVRVAMEMGRAGLGIELDRTEADKAREWLAEPMQGRLIGDMHHAG